MEALTFFGLIAAIAFFWNRLQRTENRLAVLEERHSALLAQQVAALTEKQPAHTYSERVTDVPATATQQSPVSDAAAATPVSPADQPAEPVSEPPQPEETRQVGGVRVRKTADAATQPSTSVPLTIGATAPKPAPVSAPIPAMALAQEDAVATQNTALDDTPEAPRKSFDFEDIFGRRLPIWAGGVALAISGVFLVRYSIEAGLMTPLVRVIAAFLFGLLLLAGAEVAYRFKERVADPRVAQALAGAGLATLYAGFYLAGTQYGLIGQTFAFIGLAAVTAAAIALSYRFGLPSAVLGLIGGFATPALVGGDEANLPLLSLYLGLVTAGLTMSGRHQQRPWMGIAALIGGLGWGFVLLLAGEFGVSDTLALGLYMVALGAVIPALAGAEKFEQPLRLAAALIAAVQLALLVDQGGYAPLAWGLYLLLGAALAWFGWRQPEVRGGSAMAAVVGVGLYQLWGWDNTPSSIPQPLFTVVGAGLAAIFALVPLALTWRERDRGIDRWQFILMPLALALVALSTFIFVIFDLSNNDNARPMVALASLALAAIPLTGAWLIRTRGPMRDFASALGSGGLLVFIALALVTPSWMAPVMAAIVVMAIALLAHQRARGGAAGGVELANLLWIGAFGVFVALTATPHIESEGARMVGLTGEEGSPWRALIRWLATALPFAAIAWIDTRKATRPIAEAVAAALLYAALAQVVPVVALVWVTAGLAVAAMLVMADRPAIQVSLATIAVLWAIPPLGEWLAAGLESLSGVPMFVDSVPDLRGILTRLLPAALALGTLRYSATPIRGIVLQARWLAVPFLLIALHGLFKQIFAIETVTAFVNYGMAERTLWEALLLGAGWLAWGGLPRIGQQRWLAITLAATSLVHFLLYTGLLHNPLLTEQAVGPTPIANWILASHAVALIAVLSLRRWAGDLWQGRFRPAFDGLAMAIASIGALALLRQIFAGTILVDTPMGQTEDLLRSLLGIVLALAFLFIGSRLGERSWRIGSLVLMVLAVIKVFLFDAAGLEGLLRIASFMALGFSLIGIGWLYTRVLARRTHIGTKNDEAIDS